MRTNYVLIDYENVQPSSLHVLEKEHFKVIIFVGANQTKISFEIASILQRLGTNASYIKISGNGPNTLDLHIAFYIGQIAANDSSAFFHIISKDTGFDPLIVHLKTKKIFACRSNDVGEMPIIKASSLKSTPERVSAIITNFKQRGASKPRLIKTLSSTINSLFQKSLSEEELTCILDYMQKEKIISLSDNKVSYSLPE